MIHIDMKWHVRPKLFFFFYLDLYKVLWDKKEKKRLKFHKTKMHSSNSSNIFEIKQKQEQSPATGVRVALEFHGQ